MSPTGYPDYPTSLTVGPLFTVLNAPISVVWSKSRISTYLMNMKRLPPIMRANSTRPWLLLAMLISCAVSGCLGGGEGNKSENPIDMEVYYESTSGTIEEVVQNGATLSQSGVELSFDFARVTSKSGNMKTFSYDPGDDADGANIEEVNANEQAEITYTYQTHGMFSAILTAIDESDNVDTITLQIRIDKEFQWTQTNTNNPAQMLIPTTPDCDCPVPEKIDIDSTITNRNSIPPTQNTYTWHLSNPDGEEEAFHTEQIGDGDDGSWAHSQYNLVGGDWALEVTIDTTDGNDERIDIAHTVSVLYEPLESEPNPFSAEDSDS